QAGKSRRRRGQRRHRAGAVRVHARRVHAATFERPALLASGGSALIPRQRVYCAFTPAALTMRASLSISVRTNRSNSSGVEGFGTAPLTARRSLTSGRLSTRTISAEIRFTSVRGVAPGAKTPYHVSNSNPGRPASATVGTSANAGARDAVLTA